MLTIKNKIMLVKLSQLTKKRNKAFKEGDYQKAAYYGKLVNDYIANVMKLEDGVNC